MGNKVNYEWCCEYVDDNGDIIENDFGDKLSDVWPARRKIDNCTAHISLIRDVYNEVRGLIDRQYAYPDSEEFDGDAKIPVRFKKLLT